MKRLAVVLALLTGGLFSVGAAATNGPALRVGQQGDSVRVIAQWKLGCDTKGCPDSARVAWTVRGAPVKLRHLTRAVDTLWFPAPAWGDSALVQVAIAGVRRNAVGTVRTATATVRRIDAPPPPPDSVRVDTLALREALEDVAEADSFPLIVVRAADGSGAELREGAPRTLCALGRNRYTGVITIFAEVAVPDSALTRLATDCEGAAARYATERGG